MVIYFVACFFTHNRDNAILSGPSTQPLATFVIMSAITTLVAEAILLLRVYTVYHKNQAVLGILSLFWVTHLVLMAVVLKRATLLFILTINFFTSREANPFMALRGLDSIMIILPAIVFDAVVGAFLTFGLYQRSASYRSNMPLVKLIIRDGILYFSALFITNVIWLVLSIYSSPKSSFGLVLSDDLNFVPLEALSTCITTTMLARLTLNLRKYDPAVNNEFRFGDMTGAITRSLRFRDHTTVTEETVGAG
ncbi:hypothetical protein BDZ94DRAFT_1247868 [Collybia nuda]|uniref:Uncharacterized protein n=1 Tax=Collybia nuda TaxID=64659 RepID=A0A9P5YHR5_9AGAR|nr:hypothetical protein BDZ94DRAFT_1247868 [Collybia nuda]